MTLFQIRKSMRDQAYIYESIIQFFQRLQHRCKNVFHMVHICEILNLIPGIATQKTQNTEWIQRAVRASIGETSFAFIPFLHHFCIFAGPEHGDIISVVVRATRMHREECNFH